MFKVTYNFLRHTKGSVVIQGYIRINNLVSVPVTATSQSIESEDSVEQKRKVTSPINNIDKQQSLKSQNSLVAAAFSLLNDNKPTDISTPFTDSRLKNAMTIDELLSIPEGNGVSRRLALKIISVLSDWATAGKIEMQHFETDPRFIRLCKVLTKGTYLGKTNRPNPVLHNEDLTTILGMTAEEDAAKLLSSISLPHMAKVLSFLASKHNRSTTLLRTIAYTISGKAEHLNLKLASDILYSCSILNFLDENLLEKICRDTVAGLEEFNNSSSIIASIATSLGILRYKNLEILDALSNWILKHQSDCRPQDIFTLFITLGILNYQPTNAEDIYKVLIPQLNMSDAKTVSVWLDVVWSLVVLNQATPEHLSSVLSESFISKLMDVKSSYGTKLKLLNIDSACDLLTSNYTGSRIPSDSNIKRDLLVRSKDKEKMVNLLQDSLSSLFNQATHMKANTNSNMGFYIDAEIALDNKNQPLSLKNNDARRVAVLAYDFHDMCRGRIEPTGITALNAKLLEAQGYRILAVPYTEFSCSDKYVNRVKYLESRLKVLPVK